MDKLEQVRLNKKAKTKGGVTAICKMVEIFMCAPLFSVFKYIG